MSEIDPTEESIPKSVTKAVVDRLTHPVTGVFTLVWALFNWRMLFFLVVADEPAKTRISSAMSYSDWMLGLLWPATVTVLYILIAPLLRIAVGRWNEWIMAAQSLRAYEDSLIELQRKTELEQRAMHSMQPLLRQQQEQKVRMEKELEHLVMRKADLQMAIREIGELSSIDWQSYLQSMIDMEHTLGRDLAHKRLAEIVPKLNRVQHLRDEIQKAYPEIKWD